MCLAVDTAVPSLAPRRLHSYTAVFAICPTKEMAPPLPNATCVPISSAAQATTRPARCSRWRGRSRTTSGTGRRSAFALSPAQLPVIAAPKRDPAPRYRGTKERERMQPRHRGTREMTQPRHRGTRETMVLPVIAAPKRETMQPPFAPPSCSSLWCRGRGCAGARRTSSTKEMTQPRHRGTRETMQPPSNALPARSSLWRAAKVCSFWLGGAQIWTADMDRNLTSWPQSPRAVVN